MTSVRLAHSRFLNSRPTQQKDSFDKVVTSVWSYDPETSILTYGATVYKKADKSDTWSKREHKERAMQRFTDVPIRVKLLCAPESSGIAELESTAVDWFISTHLVFEYGTHNKTVPDVRRIHHERYIRDDFNTFYDPYHVEEKYVLGGPKPSLKTRSGGCFPLGCFFSTLFCIAGVVVLHIHTF
jgi:hypothetical protein